MGLSDACHLPEIVEGFFTASLTGFRRLPGFGKGPNGKWLIIYTMGRAAAKGTAPG
jgi:hypothetical protein